MTEDMLTAKIAHGFDHLDADGDGLLSEDDHVLLGKRAAAELGHAPGSPEESWIINAYLAIWNGLHRPHLPEGIDAIDKATFVASTRTLAEDPEAAEATVGQLARTFHAIADADASGDVSREEFKSFSRSHFPGLSDEDIATAFKHLDLDGDGTLTEEEFVAAIVEYWSSTDPDAPGNWWMGEPVYAR
ncbi:EF-hand domain-containing protein [Glycomyces terrestris]|uniref:EF-hand domain-containing protein n=1 Tax=Glycomyces terrestris TaxID=2493553 RepID=A0A426UYG0_9ACTN|nr:EF-hand domain-containing protein [Glycomyces terrestris]RRR99606.1 EF-hand domain-containing protein [Glycomyces terrestris]